MNLSGDHSDLVESQPTQLIEYALAASPAYEEDSKERSHTTHSQQQSANSIASRDFSADSIIPPRRETITQYHLFDHSVSTDQNKDSAHESSEWGSQKENAPGSKDNKDYQCNINQSRASSPHDASMTHLSIKLSNPNVLNHSVPFTASTTGKVNASRALSFEQSLAHPTKSMPPISNRYHRSPSPASQDSFGGPVSQDPEAQFIAKTKEFHVPLSDLGETPTQEVVHDDADPEVPLSDASEHHVFLDAAMARYEAQKAGRAAGPSAIGNILVAATPTPSESVGSSSGTYPHRKDDQFLKKDAVEQGSQESTQPFDFDQTPSSFDRLLDKEAAARTMRPVPEPEPTQPIASTLVGASLEAEPPTCGAPSNQSNRRQRSETPQWILPAASAAVTSSNPRSLLRLVNPNNAYRIAKLRQMHGDVAPPSYVSNSVGTETQPSHIEETQPSIPPQAQRDSSGANTADGRSRGHRVNTDKEVDPLDVVPDSEPLRAGLNAPSSADDQSGKRSSILQGSTIKHSSHNATPSSSNAGKPPSESDDDMEVPLASKLSAKAASKTPMMHSKAQTQNSRKPKSAPVVTNTGTGNAPKLAEDRGKSPISVQGKAPTRGMKKEPTVVPSSAPEQDLQTSGAPPKQPSAATSSRPPASKRQRARQPRVTSRARPPSVGNKVEKRKRPLSSDTESTDDQVSEDSVDTSPEVAKRDEEEDIEELGDSDVDVVSPAPVHKAGPSHKRRRLEDAKPSSFPRSSVSTHRNSSTPLPVLRSVTRLRSGMSTTRASAEPATRVFALWKQDGHFYSGTIHSATTRQRNSKYLVKFDDGTDDEVVLKNLRRCELMVGDNVILMSNDVRAKVSDVSEMESRSVIQVKVDDGESIVTSEVEFRDIRIANRTLQVQWKNRILDPGSIVPVVKPKSLQDITTPSKQSLASLSGKPRRELAKTGFVVTLSVKNTDPDQTKDDTMQAIKQNGGQVVDDWSSVFTMEGRYSQSSKRWTVTPEDFHLREDVDLDRVFLLSDDANQKPKFLIALALGIPCLNFEWLTKTTKPAQDWQPFLLPAGYSETLGARISQLVDLDWGNCSEYLQDILSNQVAPKLFSNKTFLCVGADFVPPHRGRKNASNVESTRAVPWIILCMGASRVEAVTDIEQVPSKELQGFDYVIVKDLADIEDPEVMTVANIGWVKECLISSRIVPRDSTQS